MFVYGVFWDEASAADAVERLVNADFAGDDISVLMHEGPEVEELPVEEKTGAARGALIGAALGAIGGALLAPGAGLMAAGPLLAALRGAIAGGAAGVGFGAVGGLGYWHDEVDFMHHHMRRGVVITTDLAFPLGSNIKPLSCNLFITSQSKPFHTLYLVRRYALLKITKLMLLHQFYLRLYYHRFRHPLFVPLNFYLALTSS